MKRESPKNSLKASRKGSREAEIAMYGHPIPHHKVHQSKKTYSRAKMKAGLKNDRPCYVIMVYREFVISS